ADDLQSLALVGGSDVAVEDDVIGVAVEADAVALRGEQRRGDVLEGGVEGVLMKVLLAGLAGLALDLNAPGAGALNGVSAPEDALLGSGAGDRDAELLAAVDEVVG